MDYILSQKRILLAAFFIITILTFGRLVKNNFDFSGFIVAGSDFVDSSKTAGPIIIQHGPGYDGQFFYRYALGPLNFKKTDHGVTVDHPSYRMQRIAYPLLAWLFSFGGYPGLIPIMLVLVNIAAFLGIVVYTGKFISLVNGNPAQGYLPLFLCGIYMSFARDLSEVVELFFFVGTVYYIFRSDYLKLSLFATFTLLSRDTSLIVLFPVFVCLAYRNFRTGLNALRFFYLATPFVVFSIWKLIIYLNMPKLEFADGYQKMGLPFIGIIDGFFYNLNFSNTKHILEFLFWVGYLIWNIFLVVLVYKAMPFKNFLKLSNENILSLAYIIWFMFALCITLTIYVDDWGFVRIFSLWNMIGFLILIVNKKQTGIFFNSFSILLVLLTLTRLIVRA
ncbi:MAG: hypothetical protein ACT4ON_08850 [Bacteroidota bacterium]